MDEGCLSLNGLEEELIRTLLDHRVRFVVIGGHAVNVYGYERPVGNLDLVVDATPENAARVMPALREHGLGHDLSISDLEVPGRKIRLKFHEVDLLTSIAAIPFGELWASRMKVVYGDLQVPVCSKEHLLRMKIVTGREEDRRDIDALGGSASATTSS